MDSQIKAFLSTIAWSELGPSLIEQSDNGYNVIVGSTPSHLILFDSYDDHPRKLIRINKRIKSTAAGRYQILSRYFDAYRLLLHLPDFSPASQDKIALQLINECHALRNIKDGDIEAAIHKCSSRWASFPGSPYGQHTHAMGALIKVFKHYGGAVR